MPVAYKHWFLKRLEKELSKEDSGASPDMAKGPQTPARGVNFRQLQQALMSRAGKKDGNDGT